MFRMFMEPEDELRHWKDSYMSLRFCDCFIWLKSIGSVRFTGLKEDRDKYIWKKNFEKKLNKGFFHPSIHTYLWFSHPSSQQFFLALTSQRRSLRGILSWIKIPHFLSTVKSNNLTSSSPGVPAPELSRSLQNLFSCLYPNVSVTT